MVNGVHFLALAGVKARLESGKNAYDIARRELDEAIKMGDLRENSEYEAAKATIARIERDRNEMLPVLSMDAVRSSDNVSLIEEGSIIHLTVHSVTHTPVMPNTEEFEALKAGIPEFDGVVMYGATLSFQELMQDNALSAETAIGKYILGRQPGDYTIAVLGGFSNITVEKLSSTTKLEELYCRMPLREQ